MSSAGVYLGKWTPILSSAMKFGCAYDLKHYELKAQSLKANFFDFEISLKFFQA